MTSSNEIDKIAPALVAFQDEVGNPKKTADNPFFKSKYADLDGIINTIRPTLAAHGLCVIQSPEGEGNTAKVATRIIHSSGQWIEGTLSLTAVKGDPQGMGSAITYARRYSLAGICGLAQDDDDGNSASGKDAKATAKPAAQPAPRSTPQATPQPAKLGPQAPIGKTPEEGMRDRCAAIVKQLGLDKATSASILRAHGGTHSEAGWAGVDWAGVLAELTNRQRMTDIDATAEATLSKVFDGMPA